MRRLRSRGSALLVALGAVALMSAFAVGLVSLVRLEAAASANNLDGRRATLVAEAGINRALAELAETFTAPLSGRTPPWAFLDKNGDFGHGVSFADAGRISLWSANAPRPMTLAMADGSQLPFSGSLGATYSEGGDVYSLKIIDCTTQLDLNDERPGIAKMLDNLGLGIAEQRGRDPVRGRGALIVALRDANGRFASKREVARLVGAEDWRLLADFVTVDGWADPAARRALAVSERDPKIEDMTLPRFVPERRCPVNVNAAPKAVLIALLAGVGTTSGEPVSIDQAKKVADLMVRRRASVDPAEGPFHGIVDLSEFLVSLSTAGGQAILTPDQAGALVANFDPNLRVVEVNPDTWARLPGRKYDLDYRTTEATFYSHGRFEVASLGRIVAKGQVVAESYRMAIIKAYEVARQTTQLDFESNALSATTDNVCALPNQTRRLGGWAASNDEGYVQLSDPEAQIGVDCTGVRVFQAPFTGTLDGNDPDHDFVGGTFLGAEVVGFFDTRTGIGVPGGPHFFAATSPNGGFWPALGERLEDKLVLSGGDLMCDGTHTAKRRRKLFYAAVPPVTEGTLDLWLKVDQDSMGRPGSVIQAVNVLSSDVVVVTELTASSDGQTLQLELDRKVYFESSTSVVPYGTSETRTRATLDKLGTYGEWHHVVIGWKSGTEARLYVDGSRIRGDMSFGFDKKRPNWPPPCELPARDELVVGGHDAVDGPLWHQMTVDDVVVEGPPAHVPDTFLEPERYPARNSDFVARYVGAFGPFGGEVEFGTLFWTERDPKSWGKVKFAPGDFSTAGLLEGVLLSAANSGTTSLVTAPLPKPGKKGKAGQNGNGRPPFLRPELALLHSIPAPDDNFITYEIQFKYDRDNLLKRGIVAPPLNVSPVLDDVTLTWRTRAMIVRTETDED